MQDHQSPSLTTPERVPWNKGKLIGAKRPLRPRHVWSIRTKLQIEGRARDLAMFNLAIDSKLRGCDVVALKVEDVAPSGYAVPRATVRRRKTGRPVRFELTEQTRQAIEDYLRASGKKPGECWPSWRGTEHDDKAICPAGVRLGDQHRAGSAHFRYALTPADQGNPDLSADRQPASRAASAGPHQDREHRQISRHRGQ
jgi:integrase